MWLPKNQGGDKKAGSGGLVAVAIDRDKNSQTALKWAVDNLLQRGQTVILIHVKLRPSNPSGYNPRFGGDESTTVCKEPDAQTREMFLPFRCFCTRKDIQCKDVMLEDIDVGKALIEYVSHAAIDNVVLGASTKSFLRFKGADIPGSVGKGAPDFCNVYVIAKGKIQSMRSALRPAPSNSPFRIEFEKQLSMKSESSEPIVPPTPSNAYMRAFEKRQEQPTRSFDEFDTIRSPFTRRGPNGRSYPDLPSIDSDISYVSAKRPNTDPVYPYPTDHLDYRKANPTEIEINKSFESSQYERKSSDASTHSDYSAFSHESSSSPPTDDVDAEMKRLKLELKQTMEMYSTACKEALTAKQKATELQRWKKEEERKLEEARLSEEAALAMAEKERAKSKAAIEAAEAAKKIADLEAQKRINFEKKALQESEERRRAMQSIVKTDIRYRRYTIEEIEEATGNFQESRKIGEGGYGPVYKCYLDHTPVAIKVLRPDAAQGRSQFQQEVEVLSCIRHPNMVLLLGACPEYGCLVYEFMANGSLEDCLFRRGNNPSLSWQLRFRIAAEIGTGLLFLHQSKPEPLVHRDLKPGNILLDRNFVSKIGDVGLARLVPPSVADTVTQYRMTSTAGTFCYIDPEYQQTGMLGVKSDVYSLGVMFLQLITAKTAMGLTHHVERAIENGTLDEMLDPSVTDWPMEEVLGFAKMALKCTELRRKDRPDLGKVILPVLNRLRVFAEENMHLTSMDGDASPETRHSQISLGHSSYPASTVSSRNVSTTLT